MESRGTSSKARIKFNSRSASFDEAGYSRYLRFAWPGPALFNKVKLAVKFGEEKDTESTGLAERFQNWLNFLEIGLTIKDPATAAVSRTRFAIETFALEKLPTPSSKPREASFLKNYSNSLEKSRILSMVIRIIKLLLCPIRKLSRNPSRATRSSRVNLSTRLHSDIFDTPCHPSIVLMTVRALIQCHRLDITVILNLETCSRRWGSVWWWARPPTERADGPPETIEDIGYWLSNGTGMNLLFFAGWRKL
jgi:hypothetical protein